MRVSRLGEKLQMNDVQQVQSLIFVGIERHDSVDAGSKNHLFQVSSLGSGDRFVCSPCLSPSTIDVHLNLEFVAFHCTL